MARALGEQLELPREVLDALAAAYEMWDGKGWPGELAGEAIPLAARLAQLGEFAEVAHRVGGVEAVRALVRARRGGQFDPALCDLVDTEAPELLSDLDTIAAWEAVIDAEPSLAVELRGKQFDAALLAIGSFVDLKSPYMLGHAHAVAELAARAAIEHGLPELAPTMRRAGFVHDLGRLGISNSIWDKRGPLGRGERERVRLYPYLTERMLQQSAALAPLGAIAVQHRERLDGSGYPHGLSGSAIARPARILAAADAYQAMRELRPHRPARSPADAANELRAGAKAGHLDAEAVEAVLGAAGHRISRRRDGPFGLTAREVDVLRLLAIGLSNKEIAHRLVITPKTVGNHVEHIYAKIDVRTRAGAGFFAMQHGLLPEETFPAVAPVA
jgi:HD-GYP domain-containing protein (c-di-GMP phosphodiesterase class II)